MGPGPRGPFQRALSMDGKPPVGPVGTGRRPMLIKQENMMGSPDGYPGNMGECSSDPTFISAHFLSPVTFIRVCVTQSWTVF